MSRRGRMLMTVVGLGFVAAIGAGAVVVDVEANKRTSTDAFCSSCHTMARLATDPRYLQSSHKATATGVQASCGDCHIPSQNIFVETYAHVVKGVKDIISEQTHDFSDPAVWEAYRIELAHAVREEMRAQDSVTCRSCHVADGIRPRSTAGQAAHGLLKTQSVTCIDCHFNLVHAPVPPRLSFIRGSGLGVGKAADN